MKMMILKAFLIMVMVTLQPWIASALSLGRVDVASHLGEPFFAEIPLHLDNDESLSSIFVDLASPIEYRFLEVYRDPSIDELRTAIKQDARGLRVEITSAKGLQSPFINLVLRVRHGRATHFKKFPIFLSLPEAATPKLNQGKPVPTPQPTPPASKPEPVAASASPQRGDQHPFTPFSGWARTSRYGPMVYGDTILTVARRLRIDRRYTVHQVAIALFNKNRDKFSKGNINLIKEGSFLDTPTASEVEALTPAEANAAMAAQIKAWKKLTQQPRYARVAEAQKNRYAKRVRVGSQGEGVRHAAAPAVAPAAPEPKVVALKPATNTAAAAESPVTPAQEGSAQPAATPAPLSTEAQQRIAQLKADNEILQATVAANNKRLAELEGKIAKASQAAGSAKIKALEARLMRVQRQLQQERANNNSDMIMMLLYAAAGIIVLLMVAIGVLLRRQPPHPATQQPREATAPAPTEPRPDPQPEPVSESPETAAEPRDATPEREEQPQEAAAATPPEVEEAQEAETSDAAATPDPDVDYLTEADVYLRYGMEDEAEAQVEMALKVRPDDPAAHAKLVEVRQARGDSAGAEAAKSAAMALLTGSQLAAFTQLIAPAEASTDAEAPETEATATDTPAEEEVAPAAQADEIATTAPEAEDLLASISAPESDESADALLDLAQGDAAPTFDDDDELQSLLSEVSDGETTEEEENVLDLSSGGDDVDLEALMSSLDGSAAEDDASAPDQGDDTAATPDDGAQPEAADSAGDAGELDFDLSGLDLSKAKVEEPRVNTAAVDSDSDLAFDASGLDLDGIVLPGSGDNAEPAAEAAQQTQAAVADADAGTEPNLDTAAQATTDEGETETADALLDLDPTPVTPEGDGNEEPTAAKTATPELEISLDMDDLDALLASEEGGDAPSQQAKPAADNTPPNQSLDDELGALLDGLDDLDLNGDNKQA